MLPYYFLVCVFMTFQKGRRRKSTRFGIWSTWLMFGDLSQKKKRQKTRFCGECFLWNLDDPICWTWMLYARAVFWAFLWQFGFPGLSHRPSWGWAVIWWGCSPIQPTYYNLIRIFGTNQPARAYSQSLILIKKSFELRKEEGWAINNSHHHPHHYVLMTPLLNN